LDFKETVCEITGLICVWIGSRGVLLWAR